MEKRKIKRKFRTQLKSNKTTTQRFFSNHYCNKFAAYLQPNRGYHPKTQKNVASKSLKRRNFVAGFPNKSHTSQKRNALFRVCDETTKTHEKRDFGRRRHRQDQNTKLKGQFWKPPIKGFVMENAEGKGKCRSIYALIFFLLFVQSAQIGDKHSQNK